MGEVARIYGCIDAFWMPNSDFEDWQVIYTKNREVVGTLPEDDEYPPLSRDMFCVPVNFLKPGFYRHQMIHFGASFRNFGPYWNAWLGKFEKLLGELFWIEAHIHLDIEMFGQYHYLWKVAVEDIQKFYLDPPVPVSRWSFSGGPRDFP